jgi:hypothetical protein
MCAAAGGATLEAMILAFKIALWAHVLAGGVALSVFWLPLVTKKGGAAHRRAGWVYVVAAGAIALTAFVNCARMLTDANPSNDRAGVFLAYIGLIAAASAQLGVRALRTKKRATGSRNPFDLVPPALLTVGGVALAAFGVRHAMPLFVIFAALGVVQGVTQLRFWLRAPATRQEWFLAHMTGMGTSCITTVTAFLVVNAHSFGLGTFDLAVWLAPGTIGGVGLTLWKRGYARRFAGRAGNAAPLPPAPLAAARGDGGDVRRDAALL